MRESPLKMDDLGVLFPCMEPPKIEFPKHMMMFSVLFHLHSSTRQNHGGYLRLGFLFFTKRGLGDLGGYLEHHRIMLAQNGCLARSQGFWSHATSHAFV